MFVKKDGGRTMREGKYMWILTIEDRNGKKVTVWSHITLHRLENRSSVFEKLMEGLENELGVSNPVVHYFYLEKE